MVLMGKGRAYVSERAGKLYRSFLGKHLSGPPGHWGLVLGPASPPCSLQASESLELGMVHSYVHTQRKCLGPGPPGVSVTRTEPGEIDVIRLQKVWTPC